MRAGEPRVFLLHQLGPSPCSPAVSVLEGTCHKKHICITLLQCYTVAFWGLLSSQPCQDQSCEVWGRRRKEGSCWLSFQAGPCPKAPRCPSQWWSLAFVSIISKWFTLCSFNPLTVGPTKSAQKHPRAFLLPAYTSTSVSSPTAGCPPFPVSQDQWPSWAEHMHAGAEASEHGWANVCGSWKELGAVRIHYLPFSSMMIDTLDITTVPS